jgi:nucleoside-diphosphate-sugar epimerase
MARILIAGCGYVGEAAAALFHEQKWEVEGWTGSVESAARLGNRPYPVRSVDITDRAAVAAASGDFDVIVQCVSTSGGEVEDYRRLYLEGARNLLQRFPSSRLLFTSSTSVYAQRDGEVVDEKSAAEPVHEKGKILRETEELIVGAGGIVARLGGIHGPGRSFFLSRFLDGTAVVDPTEQRFINQVHRDDISSALLHLAERRIDCEGQIFNVVGDQPIRACAAYEWLRARLQKPLPSPSPGESAVSRKRGQSNKQVSNAKLRAFGWAPRYPDFEAAMTKSILPSFGF